MLPANYPESIGRRTIISNAKDRDADLPDDRDFADSANEQARLRAHLATRASLFSTERFMQQVRAAVAEAAALAQGAVATSSRKPASRASSSS